METFQTGFGQEHQGALQIHMPGLTKVTAGNTQKHQVSKDES